MRSLQDKVGIVTGASYGVGRAISIGLAREGCDLILVARSKEQLEETQRRVEETGRRAIVCPTDISKDEQIAHLHQTVQRETARVDFIVNCAFGHIGEDEGLSLIDVLPSELAQFSRTSIEGNWYMTREFALMLRESSGRLVYIVADWGFPQHNILLSTTYTADVRLGSEAFVSAKYAIKGLVDSVERMLGVPGTGIYPGVIGSEKPSSVDKAEREYFDIDDPIEEVDAEYGEGSAIPLISIVEAVIFSLRTDCVVKAILLKPRSLSYDGLGL